jgi:uroporphyrinogen-III synthase
MLHIETEAHADLGTGPWGGVLVTSANAVRAIASHARNAELVALPVFAVGRRSGEAARAAGFADMASADGDAADLARLVAARGRGARLPLLHVAGEDRAGDLAGELARHGIAVETIVAYRAVAATALPSDVRDALAGGAIDGVLHYSRRSADAFTAAVLAAGVDLKTLKTKHYCLSAQVADGLREIGVAAVAVAPRPDEAALLALVG